MTAITLLEAVNRALHEGLERDDRVVVLGEDVAASGGAFGATAGLHARFGERRCFDLPGDDALIAQTAVGMALYGLRPVAEIQVADFALNALQPIVAEAARMRWRTGGEFTCPLVLRVPSGGGVHGGPGLSLSPEAYFCHAPGLRVLAPATPRDARGLLAAALRQDDPVVFLEPKRLYRSARGEVDDGAEPVELGKARRVRSGSDVTLIAWGAMVPVCERAADLALEAGIEAGVLDLRSLIPLDEETLVEQVAATGRAVVVQEAPLTGGFAAEVAATLADRAIEYLDAPVVRVGAPDAPAPYSHEDRYLPDARRVLAAIERVVDF